MTGPEFVNGRLYVKCENASGSIVFLPLAIPILKERPFHAPIDSAGDRPAGEGPAGEDRPDEKPDAAPPAGRRGDAGGCAEKDSPAAGGQPVRCEYTGRPCPFWPPPVPGTCLSGDPGDCQASAPILSHCPVSPPMAPDVSVW